MQHSLYICPLQHLIEEVMAKIIIYRKKAEFCKSKDDVYDLLRRIGYKAPLDIAENDVKLKYNDEDIFIREALAPSLEEDQQLYNKQRADIKKKSLADARARYYKRMDELNFIQIGDYECTMSLTKRRSITMTIFASSGFDAYKKMITSLKEELQDSHISLPEAHSKNFTFKCLD